MSRVLVNTFAAGRWLLSSALVHGIPVGHECGAASDGLVSWCRHP